MDVLEAELVAKVLSKMMSDFGTCGGKGARRWWHLLAPALVPACVTTAHREDCESAQQEQCVGPEGRAHAIPARLAVLELDLQPALAEVDRESQAS